MTYRTKPESENEVPLEDNLYFKARLAHLEECEPQTLVALERSGRLLDHLRQTAVRAAEFHLRLLEGGSHPPFAEERVLASVADPQQPAADLSPRMEQEVEQALKRFNKKLLAVEPTYLPREETAESPMPTEDPMGSV